MMNELSILDELLNGDCGFFSTMASSYTPDVDVVQTKDAYTITMDLPGKCEKDVDISLKDNVITIASVAPKAEEAEKAETKEETEKPAYILRERRNASFTRSFKLPRDIDVNGVSATFTNGVLSISIPRKPEEEAKKIAIKVA